MIPSAFVSVDHFSRTPSGKVDRLSLPKPDRSRPDIGQEYIAPDTGQEKAIAEIWRQVLKIDSIGIHDSFFDLGGDSIKALNAVLKLASDKGIELPIVKLFQYQTIHRIAGYLENREDDLPAFAKVYERALHLKQKQGAGEAGKDGIAIVGMAGRFPGAETIDDLWANLCAGKESITFFDAAELDPSVRHIAFSDDSYIRARGIISDADKFDAGFFNITRLEAQMMDPQQRAFLETAWASFEDAGYDPSSFDGLIGVYAGMSNNTYYPENILKRPDLIDRYGKFQTMLVNEKDYLATRTAYKLNLTGPCVNVYTACSTSLVAICHAVTALKNYQCDMALAGGVTITAPIKSGYFHQQGGMYSADGHTRPFDAKGSGTVFSDGCGAVVLKRLSDAIEHGDSIYAVIRGVALNNDGADKASYAAPSVDGQASVIAMAQADAGIEPGTISYVEAHGTATPVGDPIEMEALVKAFNVGTQDKRFCAVGSIKGNFGHLNAAAGVAGLIKTALSLKYKKIPPLVNFEEPNPEIDLENSPFYINKTLMEWRSNGVNRRACVSSFGVGGTNAHVILEEAPVADTRDIGEVPDAPQLFLLSAKSAESLDRMTEKLNRYLTGEKIPELGRIAYTLQNGRSHLPYRRFVTGKTGKECAESLVSEKTVRSHSSHLKNESPDVVFMFPGQGAQYEKMGLELYRSEPVYREYFEVCAKLFEEYLGVDIAQVVFGASEKGPETDNINHTIVAQPALFSMEYAMAKLLNHWGIRPSAMIGHSVGEFVAACLSGVFTIEEACLLIAHRARLLQDTPFGSMLSVKLTEQDLAPYLSADVSLAAVNSPKNCVVSGRTEEIEKLLDELSAKRIPAKILYTSHAFHSHLIEPAVAPFKKQISKISLKPPEIPVISTVTGYQLTDEEAQDENYWAAHMRNTVRFSDGVRTLLDRENAVFIEVGPGSALTVLTNQQQKASHNRTVVPAIGGAAESENEKSRLLTRLPTVR